MAAQQVLLLSDSLTVKSQISDNIFLLIFWTRKWHEYKLFVIAASEKLFDFYNHTLHQTKLALFNTVFKVLWHRRLFKAKTLLLFVGTTKVYSGKNLEH